MEPLAKLISTHEDWLIQRVIQYAKERGYTKYTSTLVEAWRISISCLSESLLLALRQYDSPPELGPEDDFTKDPIASFGILEAKRHRARGVTLDMFLGLLKYYQQSYIDLVTQSGFEDEDRERYRLFVDRFFNRVELGFCVEWSTLGVDNKMEELQFINRKMTNEKNKYLTIFESVHDPVILLNREGRIENVNHAAAEMWGEISNPGGKYYEQIKTELVLPWLTDELALLVSANESEHSLEKEVMTKKGLRYFQIKLKKMLDVSEKFSGTVIIFSDITKLKQAEKSLRKANDELELRVRERTGELKLLNEKLLLEIEERKQAEKALEGEKQKFQVLVEKSPHGTSIITSDGRYDYLNTRFVEIFGYTLQDIPTGRDWFNKAFPDEEKRKQAISSWKNDLIKSKLYNVRPQTFDVVCKDSSSKTIQFFPVTMAGGNQFVIYHDITEQETLRSQLIQSQKMEAIGNLAGGIAHDFNNLMTIVLSNTELVLGNINKDDPINEDIQEIKKAADHATDLTRKLLTFSRKQTISPEVLNLNDVIADSEKMLHRLIGENIELVTICDSELHSIMADWGQMGQVVMNLAINARDAMPDGGKLTIETHNIDLDETYAQAHGVKPQPGAYVMLAFTDTGIGMDKETQFRIFEPFFTTKEKGKGTGLGLATAYGVIKQNNGFIWVYSEPGRGTTFKIYLPVVEGKPKQNVEKVVVDQPKATETILVTEDEEAVLRVVSKVLETEGYTVLAADTIKEAIRICEQYEDQIHLLITDVIMPEMSGKELSEHLLSRYPDMRVIFMSGYTDNSIVRHGMLEPDTNYIQKPFSIEQLLSVVRKVSSGR